MYYNGKWVNYIKKEKRIKSVTKRPTLGLNYVYLLVAIFMQNKILKTTQV